MGGIGDRYMVSLSDGAQLLNFSFWEVGCE